MAARAGDPRQQRGGGRREARCETSALVVADLFERWQRELDRIPGKSKLAEAIRYALSRRTDIEQFLLDDRLDLDSNIVERAIRPQTSNLDGLTQLLTNRPDSAVAEPIGCYIFCYTCMLHNACV